MSDITTCAVKAIVHESEGGIPAVDATIEVQLSYYDIDDGFVAPEKTTFRTDENGEVVMDLWPNQLGQSASYYEIKIKYKNKAFRSIAVVPNQPTALLHEITDIPPYEGQPTGALLLAQMIVLVGRAEDAAEAAEGSETASAGSAAAALLSQQGAAGSAGAAATSETNASNSAGAAATARDKAKDWATKIDAEVEAGQGYGARYYSNLAATTLANKAENADLADTTTATKGAGRLGFAAALAYAAGTVGAFLKTLVTRTELADNTGALGVSQRGEAVSNILDQGTRFRGLRAIMDAYEPISRLPQNCMLKRLRTDYLEFAIYYPMTADGFRWNRAYFTNRFNGGAAGCARHLRTSEALLFQSNIQAAIAENQTTGIESQAATVTHPTVDATRVGAWTASATVGGVTDVRYSTAIGDTSTYSITGVSRIALRSYANSGNGGIVGVTVKESGVEVAAGLYRIPLNGGVRTVDLKAILTGLNWVPVADGLDPSKTYSVEIAVAATNPVGGRAYDAGLWGYAATAYNSTGRAVGTWAAAVFSAGNTVVTYLSGGKVVYQCTNTTKINWKFVTTPNSGKVKFKVYDNTGAEIAGGKYLNTTYDCYLNANNLVTVQVAAALVAGTYYLVVETDTTKNAASSAYRVYDAGVASYNDTLAGTLGVDTFDDQGITGASQVEGTCTLIGTGNLELAIKLRKSTDAVELAAFVGGTHGHETNPTGLAFLADGVAADYAGLAVNGTLIANTFQWSYGTTLLFPSDSSQAATATYTGTVSPGGYASAATATLTSSFVVLHEWYSYMFNVPSTILGTLALEGIAGGFGKCAIEGAGNLSPVLGNGNQTQMPKQMGGMVVWNKSYAAYGFAVNNDEVNAATKGSLFNPLISGGFPDSRSFLEDRNDSKFKLYNRAFPGNQGPGIPMAAGFTCTSRSVYRGFRASGLDVALS